MPQTFLIFDFGTNEEAAQRARHSVEGWRQSFRLDRKLLLKFDRQEPGEGAAEASEGEKKAGEKKVSGEKAGAEKAAEGRILLMVRLDFSDHERLSYQRWVDRIPGEAVFKDAEAKVIRHNDAGFEKTAEKFDSLP